MNMNLLLIVTDTLRWDYLGAYGNSWIQTPNLDRLARESVVFLDAYAEGLPTLPARRVLMTGRNVFPFVYRVQKSDMSQLQGWHPLFDEDVTLAEHLRECNYVSALFNDIYHMMKPGKNFHRGFDSWYWIRGQEDDAYALRDRARVERELKLAAGEKKVSERSWIIQHLMNRKMWRGEDDTSVAQVMKSAADWLRDYTLKNPFYMHVECFDPHEPWDPPLDYARRYDPKFDSLDGLNSCLYRQEVTEQQFANLKTAYAGEVSLVDRWVGHLLDTLREVGRLDDTLVIFTSDHGCMLGEQGELHKGQSRLRNQCTRVPLLIRHPRGDAAGTKIVGFVQHQDIMPTALSLMGLSVPDRVLGRNVWKQVKGEGGEPGAVVSAFGLYACLRTQKWNYIGAWGEIGPKTKQHRDLYDLQADPQELTNVITEYPHIVEELSAQLKAHIKKYKALTQGSIQSEAEAVGVYSFAALPRIDEPDPHHKDDR